MFAEFCILAVVATGCMCICLWLAHPALRNWALVRYFFSNTSLMDFRAASDTAWLALGGYMLANLRLFWVMWKMNRHVEDHKDDDQVEKELKGC